VSGDGRAALLVEPHTFEMRGQPVAAPGPGEVRVRVSECGICGSDLKMYSGDHPVHRPPLLLGHELVGTIDAVGDGAELAPGTPVVAFPAIGCGDCYACERGHEQLCPRMRLIGGHVAGGLADFVVMPERNAIPIPAGVPERERVLIEPLAVGVHAVERAGLEPGDRCLVIGAGPIGVFTAIVLRARSQERVVLVDRDPARLEAAARFGFETARSAKTGPELLAELGQPQGFEAVFECAGGAETPNLALACLAPLGTVVLVGVPPETIALNSIVLQRGERSVAGSMMYTRAEFGRAMDLLEAGAIGDTVPPSLVRRDFPLTGVSDAFALLAEGRAGALKIVLQTANPKPKGV
jgi:L-iditol 2-dehydrogenase